MQIKTIHILAILSALEIIFNKVVGVTIMLWILYGIYKLVIYYFED